MSKTKGPLFSVDARGSVGKALTYQKGFAGKYVRKYNKPGGSPSASQETIRQYTKEAVALWQWMTSDEKELWNRYIKKESIADNLILLWPLNEGSGAEVHGRSIFRIDGTITGATWTDGYIGKALNFTADGQKVQTAGSSYAQITTGDFSMEVRIKTEGCVPGDPVTVVLRKWWASRGYGIYILPTGKIRAAISGNATVNVDSIGTINDNEWHHIIFTIDRDGYGTVYIDGEYDNKVDVSASQGSLENTFNFILSYSGWEYIGLIDNVAIYNKVLTPTEVGERANRDIPRITFPTGNIPVTLPSTIAYSGYHCFISQYSKNRISGLIPWRLPTGVYI